MFERRGRERVRIGAGVRLTEDLEVAGWKVALCLRRGFSQVAEDAEHAELERK